MSLVLNTSVYANDEAQYQKSIEKIAKEISAISRNINANKKALKSERDKLFETERNLSSLNKAIKKTQKEIDVNKQQYAELGEKLESAKIEQQKNKEALSNLIESRYKNANDDYIKTLLNQENPYAVGRLSNYHGYFSKAFQIKLKEVQEQLKGFEQLTAQHTQTLVDLESKQQKQSKQQAQLEAAKKQRTKSINKLNKKVATSSEKVEQLQKNRNRLDSLLKQIAKQKEQLKKIEEQNAKNANRPKRTLVKGGFIKQKGRLSYPAQGKHKRKYGSRLAESGMLSEGLFIETNGSQAVKSIFRGRVIFAEFLKGYGLLLIIDHGDDYISLYGHNNSLNKKVGDIVETNEVVARSGVTGGLKSTGLYFEIRNNTTPVDPSTWCQ